MKITLKNILVLIFIELIIFSVAILKLQLFELAGLIALISLFPINGNLIFFLGYFTKIKSLKLLYLNFIVAPIIFYISIMMCFIYQLKTTREVRDFYIKKDIFQLTVYKKDTTYVLQQFINGAYTDIKFDTAKEVGDSIILTGLQPKACVYKNNLIGFPKKTDTLLLTRHFFD